MNTYILIGIILIALGSALTFVGAHKKIEEINEHASETIQNEVRTQTKDILKENESLRDNVAKYQTEVVDLQTSNRTIADGNQQLLSSNKALLADIQHYQKELEARDERIKTLEKQSKNAARGVMSRYDFNGAYREQSGGRMSVIAGKEAATFQTLVELEKKHDYRGLLAASSEAVRQTPDWLTPYFFRGIAQANLGNRSGAIQSLRHVVERAPDDRDYAQAAEILRKLEQQ